MDVIKELTIKSYSSIQVELSTGEHAEIRKFYPAFFGALYRQEKNLLDLISQIKNFEFIPEDIDNNPEIPDHLKQWRKDTDTRVNRLRNTFGNSLSDARISIIIFCCSLLEGLIGEYLLLKSKTNLEFDKFQKMGFIKKWVETPKQFSSGYLLSAGLQTELEELYLKRRKLIIHDKPTLKKNYQVEIQGKSVASDENETELLLNWCRLPEKLIMNLLESDPDVAIMGSNIFHFKINCQQNFNDRKYYIK
jgi:hypothetical protein